jgi:hypothetical protein
MRAASLFLQYSIGVTTRKVVQAMEGLAQFTFVAATLLSFGRQAAKKAKPLAQDIAEKLRSCDANYADETHYRINGDNAYIWFHGNEDLAHFCVAGTRSGKVSRIILGLDYQGGLVMDCYSGYDRHKTKLKQRCLAHLKRSAKDWCKLIPPEAHASHAFFTAVSQWVKRACKWHRTWKSSEGPGKESEAQWLRTNLSVCSRCRPIPRAPRAFKSAFVVIKMNGSRSSITRALPQRTTWPSEPCGRWSSCGS